MLKKQSRNSITQMFLGSKDQLKLISGNQRQISKNLMMRNQSMTSFNSSTFKRFNTGITTKCNSHKCNRTKEGKTINIKTLEKTTEETNTTTEEVVEEEIEVEAEVVVEVAITKITIIKVKIITKIDKVNKTTKIEDLKGSNNQAQVCHKHLNHKFNKFKLHLNKCSSSQLNKCKSLTCNQLMSLLSLLFKDNKETNLSETVFTATSKPLSVTNLLQELLVCFWMTMPVLTSNNS